MPVDRRLVKTEKAEDPSRYRTIGTLARIAAFPVRIAQACKPSLLAFRRCLARSPRGGDPVRTLVLASAMIICATTASLAQSLPNYGPNPPPGADSFGQPPTGTLPPGVSRYSYRAYPYHRHWRYYGH